MMQWISVDEALPEMTKTYPAYPLDQRTHTEYVFVVRGIEIDEDYDYLDAEDRIVVITTEHWIYSVARLMRRWDHNNADGGWINDWDTHNERFWHNRVLVTHWMALTD